MPALHDAVIDNDIRRVQQLVRSVPLNTLDENGRTALYYALQANNERIVWILCLAGADSPPPPPSILEKITRYRAQQLERAAIIRHRYTDPQKRAIASKKQQPTWLQNSSIPQTFRNRYKRKRQELDDARAVVELLPSMAPDVFERLMRHLDAAYVPPQEKKQLVRYINQNSEGAEMVTQQSLDTMDRARLAGWYARFRKRYT